MRHIYLICVACKTIQSIHKQHGVTSCSLEFILNSTACLLLIFTCGEATQVNGGLNVSRHILYVDCQYFSLVHFVSNLKKCSKYHDPVRLLCISEHRYVLNVRKS